MYEEFEDPVWEIWVLVWVFINLALASSLAILFFGSFLRGLT